MADVAWAASTYVDWTGDQAFLSEAGPGLPLLVETARYWQSRVRFDRVGRAHIYGVVGPDEYHEPVDDNAFTNVMARWNLRRAVRAAEGAVGGVGDFERLAWIETADALVDGFDRRTGLYEQFAGFYRLDPLVIKEVADRRPVAADALLGRDRVRRAQVVKQADVLMLHHMVPDEVAPGSLLTSLRILFTSPFSNWSPTNPAGFSIACRKPASSIGPTSNLCFDKISANSPYPAARGKKFVCMVRTMIIRPPPLLTA